MKTDEHILHDRRTKQNDATAALGSRTSVGHTDGPCITLGMKEDRTGYHNSDVDFHTFNYRRTDRRNDTQLMKADTQTLHNP